MLVKGHFLCRHIACMHIREIWSGGQSVHTTSGQLRLAAVVSLSMRSSIYQSSMLQTVVGLPVGPVGEITVGHLAWL